jgi:hypothetical protein
MFTFLLRIFRFRLVDVLLNLKAQETKGSRKVNPALRRNVVPLLHSSDLSFELCNLLH